MIGVYDGEEVRTVLTAGERAEEERRYPEGAFRKAAHGDKDYSTCPKRCVPFRCWSFRWWISALIFVLAFATNVSVALAAETYGTVDGPFVAVNGTQVWDGYVVLNVDNQYLATLALIGRAGDLIQLSSDQFAKLSNQNTGGAFYELASKFQAVGSATPNVGGTYLLWWGDTLYQQNMVSINGGYGHVWAVETNSSEIASALEDYEAIYNGNDIGGGGSQPLPDDGTNLTVTFTPYDAITYVTSPSDPSYYNDQNAYPYMLGNTKYYNKVNANAQNSSNVAGNYGVNIPKTFYNKLFQFVDSLNWSDAVVLAEISSTFRMSIYVVHGDLLTPYNDKNGNFVGYTYEVGAKYYIHQDRIWVQHPSNWPTTALELPSVLYINDNTLRMGEVTMGQNGYLWDTYKVSSALFSKEGQSGGQEPTPPNNWPEPTEPVAPSPPELPTPTDPVIPTPPTEPTPPNPPVFIVQPTFTTTTFTVDLQGILDALDEHCQHLQDALYRNIKSLNDNMIVKLGDEFSTTRTFIRQQLNWAVQSIAECFDTMNDNIYDLFHWLADQFDFNFTDTTYNDSSVLYWLRQIYSKLGSGTRTKPVDPVVDPFDFGKWLTSLFSNFIAFLMGLVGDGIGDIVDDLSALTQKFPFSIPWDIAALLALLVSEPVTPVIQFPLFYYDGAVNTVQTTIDLSPYDAYVEPVRVMIKIAFAALLAWRTKDMMEMLTMAIGGKNA